jgi:hypothetical protein
VLVPRSSVARAAEKIRIGSGFAPDMQAKFYFGILYATQFLPLLDLQERALA